MWRDFIYIDEHLKFRPFITHTDFFFLKKANFQTAATAQKDDAKN